MALTYIEGLKDLVATVKDKNGVDTSQTIMYSKAVTLVNFLEEYSASGSDVAISVPSKEGKRYLLYTEKSGEQVILRLSKALREALEGLISLGTEPTTALFSVLKDTPSCVCPVVTGEDAAWVLCFIQGNGLDAAGKFSLAGLKAALA